MKDTSSRPRVLILASDFPPYNSIGGQRPYSWLKYFHEFGLEPIVVTRHWDRPINHPDDCNLPSLANEVEVEAVENGTIIRAPFKPNLRDKLINSTNPMVVVFRKILTVWQLVTENAIPSASNKSSIFDAAEDYLDKNEVDLILACGEPFVLFHFASKLAQKHSVPWIGDYRDGWSTNYRWDDGGFYAWIQKTIHGPAEKKVTGSAAILTTAAPAFSQRVANLTGRKVENVPVIYNGFFDEKFQNIEKREPHKTFTIVHAGTIYYFQKVETLLNGLNEFKKQNPDFQIKMVFYGLNFQPDQIERIKRDSENLSIEFGDRLSHDDMLAELNRADVQLLLATPEKAQIYAKVFDYLASGRPILMVENDNGPLEEILRDRENAFLCSTENEVVSSLNTLKGGLTNNLEQDISKSNFTRRNQAFKMATVIKGVLSR
ncbi:MAG: glycosyltransferase involved in cell wall biosynthesis [Bacteroidia bacterium]|jgi:glycosyltransferase involved in cell wall biosynthesis